MAIKSRLNSEQEELKSKLHQKSEELKGIVKEIVALEARLTSIVYGKIRQEKR